MLAEQQQQQQPPMEFVKGQDGTLICRHAVRGGVLVACDVLGHSGCQLKVSGREIQVTLSKEGEKDCVKEEAVDVAPHGGGRWRRVYRSEHGDRSMGQWLLACSQQWGRVSKPYTVYLLPDTSVKYQVEYHFPY